MHTVFNDHLAVGIKLIQSRGDGGAVCKGLPLHKPLAQVQLGAPGELVAIVDEVEISLILHQKINVTRHKAAKFNSRSRVIAKNSV